MNCNQTLHNLTNLVYGSLEIATTTTMPGSRAYAVGFTASNAFYLFGGSGYDSITIGYNSDLWKFNYSSLLWSWVAGPNFVGATSEAGELGQSSIYFYPSARAYSTAWTDSSDNLWLFGGVFGVVLNDLWKWNASNGWAWMSGSLNQSSPSPGYYSKIYTTLNQPAARGTAVSWIDSQNNLWLYGGVNSPAVFDDVWMYNTTNGMWIWISGTNGGVSTAQPFWGTQGTMFYIEFKLKLNLCPLC